MESLDRPWERENQTKGDDLEHEGRQIKAGGGKVLRVCLEIRERARNDDGKLSSEVFNFLTAK